MLFFGNWQTFETDRIATAHTLSDQVETVLLHLTRGAGLRGLSGIPPCGQDRPALFAHHTGTGGSLLPVLPPSLCDRSDERGADIRSQSNSLDVVPVLESINPAFVQGIAGMVERISRDEQYLQEEAEQALGGRRRTTVTGEIFWLDCPCRFLSALWNM